MFKRLVAVGGIVLACASVPAYAQQDPGPWLVRGRIMYIDPNASNNASGPVGSDTIEVDSTWGLEVDVSYFFTKNFALELVLTYPQKHDVWSTQFGSLGNIKQLPPTLVAQYHFDTGTPWKPYVGAGITYLWITDNNLSVNGAPILDISTSNWGFALQAGVDYKLTPNWYLNADVKYIWVDTKVTDTAGLGINTTLNVNPWVLGAGVGYRF
jgi:outer membrane protein